MTRAIEVLRAGNWKDAALILGGTIGLAIIAIMVAVVMS